MAVGFRLFQGPVARMWVFKAADFPNDAYRLSNSTLQPKHRKTLLGW